MRILALDIGSKRIGVAMSDPLGITAQGLDNILRESDDKAIQLIKDIVDREEVSEIVVGLPLNMDGSKGPRAEDATHFGDQLKNTLNIAVAFWDERMSTMAVERIMLQADTRRSKRKKKVDRLAAQYILQGYLDSRHNT